MPTAGPVTPPSVAEFDGFKVESNSATQPSNDELLSRLGGTAGAPPETPAADPPVEEAAAPAEGDEAVETDEAPEAPVAEKPKKASTPLPERVRELRAKVGTLTGQVHRTNAEIVAAQARLDAINAQIKQAGGQPGETVVPGAAKAAETTLGAKPKWTDFEAQGKPYSEFEDARDEWLTAKTRADVLAEVESREKKAAETAKQAQASQTQQQRDAAYNTRLDAYVAEHPDFTTLVESNLGDLEMSPFVRDLVDQHEKGFEILHHLAQHRDLAEVLGSLPLTHPMFDAVMASTSPAPLVAYLASHPKDTDRIARLRPAHALVALGEVSARLAGVPGSPPPAPLSNAKPPTRPVAGSRSVGDRRAAADLDFGPDYVRRMNEEERVAASRR